MHADLTNSSGIYCIRHKASGKAYVGSSVDMRARVNRHFNMLRRGTHFNPLLQASFAKHGTDAFEAFVLRVVEERAGLHAAEQEFLDSGSFAFNVATDAAVSQRGRKQTPEEIERRATALIGHVVSAETREKLSAANRGRKHSAEAIAKMRGRPRKARPPMSEATKAKLRAARIGKPLSAAHRRKLSAAHMGNVHSPEQRAKISAGVRAALGATA